MILDLKEFRLPDSVYQPPKTSPQIIEVKQGDDWFIKGPLPGTWMSAAAKLPGSHTLHVALAIQYANGMRKGKAIMLSRFHLDRFGVGKDSARRALKRLKEAGLIEYEKVGQKYKIGMITNLTGSTGCGGEALKEAGSVY